MSGPSKVQLLCEDSSQKDLLYGFLIRCGYRQGLINDWVASERITGGNDQTVLAKFPEELTACRRRSKRAETLLIVVIDGNSHGVAGRRNQLQQRAKYSDRDPVIVLIPCYHIETWIRAALGESVDEKTSYKRPKPRTQDAKDAAKKIYDWAIENAPLPANCPQSLVDALTQFKRIPRKRS